MAKTLKSIDLTSCITKTRSGVKKGTRYFTRAETIRNIVAKRKRKEARGEAIDLLAAEKRKVQDEKDRKEAMLAAVAAKRKAGVDPKLPIETDKDGNPFVQPPRVKGRFAKRVKLSV